MSALNELFARDPLELTDPELDTIVAALREQRKNFDLGIKPTKAAAAKTTKAKKTGDAGADSAPTVDPKDINLEDLGF